MKRLIIFTFVISVFFLPAQSVFADEFDIEECSVDTVQFELIRYQNTDGHRYLLSGKCRTYIPFTLGAYYWISSVMGSYQEVVKHQTLGNSYLIAYCRKSPVLHNRACYLSYPMDTTMTIHRKYGLSMIRRLLTDEQMTVLESEVELAIQQGLTNQPLSKTMAISKSEAVANTSKSAAAPPFSKWHAMSVKFSVQSPLSAQSYPVAPPLKVTLPERVDFQYLVNKCKTPADDTQCEQFERTVSGSLLQCNEQETSCRFEGGLDIPWTADRRYMLIVRPLPLHYDPIIIEFDFTGIAEATDVKKRARVKQ